MQQQNDGGYSLVAAQNRKLDLLLAVAGAVAAVYLWPHAHWASYTVALTVASELLANWGGILGAAFLPVLGVQQALQLTRRQRRTRTVYKVGGQEWYAQPITRTVQEQLAACVPDAALENQAMPAGILAAMTGGSGPDAGTLRAQWMANIGSVYEQLAILLVSKANPDPMHAANHPSVDWLGDVVPVARANALVAEINERAAVEDNLPA